jgi:titin
VSGRWYAGDRQRASGGSLVLTTAEPGQDVIFIGTGFAAHSTVVISIYSSPTVLGTTVTNSHGNFRKPITIPPDLTSGAHTAVASGVAPNGTPRAMALVITVDALALTGAQVTVYATAGGSLTASGALLLLLTTRRPPNLHRMTTPAHRAQGYL